ncbi:MAG: nicotinate-nucleotide adenylyltransferase [Bacteroidales bacterium]|nr:nicotinate-nucleotide adenylyltransferase [Bacteroidales bacterium]
MEIGILGGSFNPVHIGHIALASYLAQYTQLSRVWLTLSPLNPLKERPGDLASDICRLEMLQIAAKPHAGIEVCDIELSMPRPSYTIDTLRALRKRYPSKKFRLVIGRDNWEIFDRWKAYQEIIDDFGVIVYPRPGYPDTPIYVDNVDTVRAPIIDLSSTFIRSGAEKGRDMSAFVPAGVWKYITSHHLYHT